MLDYAANCLTYWSLDMLRTGLEGTCIAAGRSSDAALQELIGLDQTIDEFWQRVKTNLIAGRVRLLFVADRVPMELRRIVEFLNAQMDPAEVLAIELRQFTGDNLKTIVPMVFGQTQEATNRKVSGAPSQRWDEVRFFEALAGNVGPQELALAHKIYDWMRKGGKALEFGTGQKSGSVYPILRPNGVRINPAYLSTDGNLWLQFGNLDGKPVFGSADKRLELIKRFGAVNGSGLGQADLNRYRALALSKITSDPQGERKLFEAMNWMDEQLDRPVDPPTAQAST